jgi:hypothetical protein
MKKYLLWSFERGSRAYDAICFVIVCFIFFTPQSVFHDRKPEYLQVASDQPIRQTNDDDGHTVWVVQSKTERDAVDRVKASLGEAVTIARTKPVYDAAGQLVAYSIWIQR